MSNNWIQQGTDILGEASGDQLGRSLSLSADGGRIALGTPFNDGNGADAGHMRVFQNSSLSTEDFNSNSFSYYPNPSRDVVNFSSKNSIEDITLYNLLGQEVLFKKVNSFEFVLDINNLPTGSYVAKLNNNGKSHSTKLVKM